MQNTVIIIKFIFFIWNQRKVSFCPHFCIPDVTDFRRIDDCFSCKMTGYICRHLKIQNNLTFTYHKTCGFSFQIWMVWEAMTGADNCFVMNNVMKWSHLLETGGRWKQVCSWYCSPWKLDYVQSFGQKFKESFLGSCTFINLKDGKVTTRFNFCDFLWYMIVFTNS